MAVHQFSDRERALLLADDDRDDSPWMVGTDLHAAAVVALYQALSTHLAIRHPDWYVSMESFVIYTKGRITRGQLAPDVYAAPVKNRPRDTFVVEREGIFPPFVAEIVSTWSWDRDTIEKHELYDLLRVDEYLLFDPASSADETVSVSPRLWGFRRDGGAFVPWEAEADGSLYSALLDVRFRAEERRIRVITAEGRALPFHDEQSAALRAADEEIARLRDTIEQLRSDLL